MIDDRTPRPVAGNDEFARLVRGLHETHRRIQELTEGKVDAVMDPSSGETYLLPKSQADLRLGEAEQRRVALERAAVLDALPAHIALLDRKGRIVAVNEAWRRFASANAFSGADFAVGSNYLEVCDLARGDCSDEARAVAAGIRSVLRGDAETFAVEYPCHAPKERRWFRLMVTTVERDRTAGAVAMHIDITERKRDEILRESEARVLESISSGAALPAVLNDIALAIEEAVPDARASILLLDPDGKRLRLVAAPRLPDAFNRAVDGLSVDPNDGACGVCGIAAHRRRPVIVVDVATDPLCEGFRDLAREHGIGACWSMPVLDRAGNVSATFAIYFDEPRVPQESDLAPFARMAHLVGIAVERHRVIEARRKTEERFRQLAETIEDVFWLTDYASEVILYVSPAFERIWGRPASDLHRNPRLWLEAIHDEDRPKVIAALPGQAEGKYNVEYRIVRPDGAIRWIVDRGYPVRDESGRVYRIAGTARDITERKQAEQATVESEERFRLLAKATNDAIWDWNLVTDALWWNEGFETLFGFKRDEVEPTSESWTNRIHPEDTERIVSEARRAIDGSAESWSGEYRFLRKDGAYAYVLDRGHIIRDPAGKAVRMIGGMTDLTERKRSEERLADQAALLDVTQDAIIVRSLDHRVQFWNKSAERLYGWTAQEAVGRSIEDLLYDDPTEFRRAAAAAMAEGQWAGRIEQRRKDNSKIVVEGTGTLVRDANGYPRAVFSVNTDITERLALEEQLRQSQKLEAVGQLTGGIAHDFNNILTVILGSAELLVEFLEGNEKLRRLARTAQTAAQRGADLTQRLLAFSRRQALEPKTVDVNRLLGGMESLLRRALTEDISLHFARPAGIWEAMVDPAQLESAILNLCINARDAMKDGGKLTIETANAELDADYADAHAEVAPGEYVMIAVTDTGTGIPPEIVGKVFDPFFTTKEQGKGTGLGLSMVYGFVKQTGGHVKIYSEVGLGTTVKLYLPRATENAAEEESPVADAASGGSETILAVEDDDLVREHVEGQLRALGYRVLMAGSGPEALDIVRRERGIDLLFTDVIMPGGMNGKELADAVRQIRPGTKVLFTSGYTENAIVHQGRLDRGVLLLSKPYRQADLARMVRVALDRDGEPPS